MEGVNTRCVMSEGDNSILDTGSPKYSKDPADGSSKLVELVDADFFKEVARVTSRVNAHVEFYRKHIREDLTNPMFERGTPMTNRMVGDEKGTYNSIEAALGRLLALAEEKGKPLVRKAIDKLLDRHFKAAEVFFAKFNSDEEKSKVALAAEEIVRKLYAMLVNEKSLSPSHVVGIMKATVMAKLTEDGVADFASEEVAKHVRGYLKLERNDDVKFYVEYFPESTSIAGFSGLMTSYVSMKDDTIPNMESFHEFLLKMAKASVKRRGS